MASGLPATNYEHVELKGYEWRNHYIAPGFLLFVALVLMLAFLGRRPERPPGDFFWFAGASTLLAALSGWWQHRALRFRRFRTPNDAETNFERVMEVAKVRDWDVLRHRQGQMVSALVYGFPGYRITVRF